MITLLPQAALHSSMVLNKFWVPWQPPYINSTHFPMLELNVNFGNAPLHKFILFSTGGNLHKSTDDISARIEMEYN